MTNLLKSDEMDTFTFRLGGNSTTFNNSGISVFLPVLLPQYVLASLATLATDDKAVALSCKFATPVSTLWLLDICRPGDVFPLNEGALVL